MKEKKQAVVADGGFAVGLYKVIHRIYEGPRAGRWVLQQA